MRTEKELMGKSKSGCCNKKMTHFKVLELFAGAGGLALGLEQAGLQTTALVEIDKYACETLKHNRPHWNVINDDVRNMDLTL